MSFFAKDNERRLRALLSQALSPDTRRADFEAIIEGCMAQREIADDPAAHDERMNEYLRRVEAGLARHRPTHEEMIDTLIEIHAVGKAIDHRPG